jgi:hypothetical protein
MITLTFEEFLNSEDLIDYTENDFELYILRDNTKILYIGIARYGIYRRWFVDPSSHMNIISRNKNMFSASSYTGQNIISSLPDSLEWKIDLWGIKELLEFLEIEHVWNDETKDYRVPRDGDGLIVRTCDIKYLESFMIRYLFPRYNSMGNNGKSANPYFEKKYFSMVGV